MPGSFHLQSAARTQHAPATHFSPGAPSRTNTPQLTLQRKPADSFDTGPRGVKGKPQLDGQGGLQYLELRKMIMDNPHLGEAQRKNLLARLDAEAKSGGGRLTQALTTMKNQNLDARTMAGLLNAAGAAPESFPALMDSELRQVQLLLDSPGWKALSPEQRQQVGTYLAQLDPSHASWMLGEFTTLLNDPVFSRVGKEAVAAIIDYAAKGSGPLSDRTDVVAGLIEVLSNLNDPLLANNPEALKLVKSDPAGFVNRVLNAAENPGMLASAKAGVTSSDYRWSDLVLRLFGQNAPPNQQSVDPRNQRSADPYPRSELGSARSRDDLLRIPNLPKPKK